MKEAVTGGELRSVASIKGMASGLVDNLGWGSVKALSSILKGIAKGGVS